jgi:ribosomal protein S17E
MSACEDYPTYSTNIPKTMTLPLKCIKISTFNPKLSKPIKEKFKNISSKSCKYRLTGYIHFVDSCNNPDTKSLGADFNGYVRVYIKDNEKIIYKVQSDFKSNEKSAIERVLQKVAKEIFLIE